MRRAQSRLTAYMLVGLVGLFLLGGSQIVAGPAESASGGEMDQRGAEKSSGIVRAEFIYTDAPFDQCHASTIEETEYGLIAAWFGGTHEKNPDVGIWISHYTAHGWSKPEEVATGIQHAEKRYPCWNPVLFQPREGPLMLYYKVGPDPQSWWGMLMTSEDGGRNWSAPRRLPEDILGPIKNKPVQLPDGRILAGSSTEHDGWKVHLEMTPDLNRSWRRVGPIPGSGEFGTIQPTILFHGGEHLQMLCRSRSGKITESWSEDGGYTWSDMAEISLPNPNSGFDAVTLDDGRHLLVYNHTTKPQGEWGGPRSPINVAVSRDGHSWEAALVLEDKPGEYSYPAVIQARDGKVHITYTWKRVRVKHVVVDPAKLELQPITDGSWPE